MIHRVTCAIAQSSRHILRQPFFVFYDEDSHIGAAAAFLPILPV